MRTTNHKYRQWSLFVVLMICFFTVSLNSAFAAAGDVAVSGVTSEDGGFLSGATVAIQCTGGSWASLTGTTDASGAIAAQALPGATEDCQNGEQLDARVSKSGYITQTFTNVLTYDASGVNTLSTLTGIQFSLRVIFADQFGEAFNASTMTTATFNGGAPTVMSGSSAYWAVAASNKALVLNKTGYVNGNAASANNAFNDVSTNTTTQTKITMGNFSSLFNSIAAGATVNAKGMLYQLKITVGNEVGNGMSPTTDVSLITINGGAPTKVVSISAYWAVEVTNATLIVHAPGYVNGELTHSGWTTVTTSTTAQTSMTTSLKFQLKIVTTDELGNTMNPGLLNTRTFNGVSNSQTSTTALYFPTEASNASLVITRTSYVNAAVTNTGFSNVSTSSTAQTVITMGANSALTSSVTAGSSVTAKGMEYPLKVVSTNELGTPVNISDLNTATFNGGAATQTSLHAAYWGTVATGGSLVMNKDGYVNAATTNTGLTSVSTSTTIGQTVVTFGTGSVRSTAVTAGTSVSAKGFVFSYKVTVTREGDGGALSGATITAGAANVVCSEDGSTGIYYCPVLAADDGGAGDISVVKSGYVTNTASTGNRTDGTSAQQPVSVSGVSFDLRVVVADQYGTLVNISDIDTITFNGSIPTYSSSNTAYFAVAASNANLTINETGYRNATTTNTGFIDVTTNATGQTTVTLGNNAARSSAITANTSVTAKGLTGAINKLVFTTQPSGCVSGLTCAIQPVVTAEDIFDNTVADFSENITITLASGSGVLSGATTVSPVSGVATFTDLVYTATVDGESFTIGADDAVGGDDPANDTSVVVASDVIATKIIVNTQPAGCASGTVCAVQPVVYFVDADDTLDTANNTDQITTSLASGGGTLSGTATVSALNGVVTFTNLKYAALSDGESFVLRFTDDIGGTNNFSSSPVSANSLTANVIATRLIWVTAPADCTTAAACSTQGVIHAVDADGVVDVDYITTVTISVVGGGVLVGDADQGVMTAGALSTSGIGYTAGNGGAEDFTFTASSGGLTPAVTGTITSVALPVVVQSTGGAPVLLFILEKINQQQTQNKVSDLSVKREVVTGSPSGWIFSKPLAFGSTGLEVVKLQDFLVLQKMLVIPAGVKKGTYGALTRNAVREFQKKYDIAKPGVPGYGMVGPMTRRKLNQILGQ